MVRRQASLALSSKKSAGLDRALPDSKELLTKGLRNRLLEDQEETTT